MLDETPSHAVDMVTRDAVEAQKRRGIIPRVHDVRSYIQGVVERMDRKQAEAQPAPVVKPAPRAVEPRKDEDALEREYRTRLARKGQEALPGKWTVERKPIDVAPFTKGHRVLKRAEFLMRKRLRLLRANPEWAAKLKRINPLALQGHLGEEKYREADVEVRKVINASDKVFGPWYKEPEKRLFFDKSGVK